MTLPPPSKIVCIGRNYVAHAAELGHDVPEEPLFFLKPPSAIVGDGDAIVAPGWVGRVDYEGEIGVVVGRRARKVAEEDALGHVAGYVPLNDVTARELQRRDGQWSRAKGFDTFCPVGPMIPAAEIGVDELEVVTRVDGEERQRAPSDRMVFTIPFLLAHVARVMTLEPGDILATGTPEGVGRLAAGDVVEVEVGGRASVRNPVRSDGAGEG